MNAPDAVAGASSWLFAADDWRARELHASDLPVLQAFFEANPEYFETVNGMKPRADEARQEFEDRPPAHLAYERTWMLGVFDDGGALVAMAGGLSKFLIESVWHLGLFIVGSAWHGSGRAVVTYRALESWIAAHGAQWVRLGVVADNAKAERFWQKVGYREVRQRTGVATGARISTIRVMVKPLGAQGLDEYLRSVERDRPESSAA